ncbi:MAG: WhiB family transcriptional regulator [Corynebacterium sp.]|nr:WhiB family transcriptional regulator [Corynebacterium sp.]
MNRSHGEQSKVLPALPNFFTRGKCSSEWVCASLFDLDIEGESASGRARRHLQAAAVCESCPIKAQCASFAESAPFALGVWGGLLIRPHSRAIDLVRKLQFRKSSSISGDR